MSEETTPTPTGESPRPHRRWYRLALTVTVLLVLAVLTSLPLAVLSMQDVLGRGPEPLFDLVTGEVVAADVVATAEHDATYVNLGMVDLDDATGVLPLAVSGNRNCGEACAALDITFVALDDDADQRRRTGSPT